MDTVSTHFPSSISLEPMPMTRTTTPTILTIAARIASLAHHGHVNDFHRDGGVSEFYFDSADPNQYPRRRHILEVRRVSGPRFCFTWTEIHWNGVDVWQDSRYYCATCRWNTVQLFSAIASLRDRSGYDEYVTRFSFSSDRPDFSAYAEAEAGLNELFGLLSAMQDD